MNYRISIRSTLVLVILALLSIALLWIVENTKVNKEEDHYTDKMAAAQLMKECTEHLKSAHFANEVAIDNINDPNETGMIGQQFTELTSGRGSLPIKLSTTNPNFAALVVQVFKEAGLKKGDVVAMGFTGSFPAANMSVCAACDVLGLRPVLITSVTSSSWGANEPDFTWPDMQHMLYEEGLLSFMPVASSIGGNEDLGQTLSNQSRSLAEAAINRNQLPYLNKQSLKANIAERMRIFSEQASGKIKLYVNVGGGVASLGSNDNALSIPSGLSPELKLKDIPDKRGVVFEMAKQGVPIANFLHLRPLLNKYGLPIDPSPLPEVGDGDLYHSLHYDLRVVGLAELILSSLLIIIVIIDKKQNKLGSALISNSETI